MHHISHNSRLDCMHVLLVLKTIVYGNFSIPSELFWLQSQRNSWYQARGVQEFFLTEEGGRKGGECGVESKKGSSKRALWWYFLRFPVPCPPNCISPCLFRSGTNSHHDSVVCPMMVPILSFPGTAIAQPWGSSSQGCSDRLLGSSQIKINSLPQLW